MKGGFYLEIKDLPQIEEATESDHVVSSISQKTRLISFKNIFEKISFSSLVTTAKNIIGSINELKGRCDTLDTSVSELNTDLTTLETGNGTKNDSLISSTGFECNYFKVGRICSVKFAFTALTDISPGGILLASDFPPAAELQYVSIPVIAPDGSVQQGNLAITTNGTLLNFYGYGIKANSWIKGGFVYITSE